MPAALLPASVSPGARDLPSVCSTLMATYTWGGGCARACVHTNGVQVVGTLAPISVGGTCVLPVTWAKNLGVILSSFLSHSTPEHQQMLLAVLSRCIQHPLLSTSTSPPWSSTTLQPGLWWKPPPWSPRLHLCPALSILHRQLGESRWILREVTPLACCPLYT